MDKENKKPYGYPIDCGYFGYNYDEGRYMLYPTEEEYMESLRDEEDD